MKKGITALLALLLLAWALGRQKRPEPTKVSVKPEHRPDRFAAPTQAPLSPPGSFPDHSPRSNGLFWAPGRDTPYRHGGGL